MWTQLYGSDETRRNKVNQTKPMASQPRRPQNEKKKKNYCHKRLKIYNTSVLEKLINFTLQLIFLKWLQLQF
jgi:hypothetical protein